MSTRRAPGRVALVLAAMVLVVSCSTSHNPAATTTTSAGSGATTTTAAGGSAGPAGPAPTVPGPEGAPVVTSPDLAPAGATGETIDGIQCAPIEQLAYHIHAHLSLFVNGQARAVPYGVGITPPLQLQYVGSVPFVTGGTCIYWLHTHAADGILHVESPTANTYTLQNFFDIWHQPLSPSQVGPAQGPVTVFVNGQPSSQDPRLLILDPHANIQLDVGQPVVPAQPFTFPSGL